MQRHAAVTGSNALPEVMSELLPQPAARLEPAQARASGAPATGPGEGEGWATRPPASSLHPPRPWQTRSRTALVDKVKEGNSLSLELSRLPQQQVRKSQIS